MLLHELLRENQHPLGLIDEDVAIRDNFHMAAFAITVAEAYDKLPRHDPTATQLWQLFAQQTEQVMLKKIASSGIKIEYSAADPYEHLTDDPKMMVRYMLWDMVVNHKLPVYTGHSDDHPVFSSEQNVIFRTVHDYFAHGKLRNTFKQQIQARGLDKQTPTPQQLAEILPTIRLDQGGNIGHAFSIRGEINAYLTHAKLAPPKTIPVLFTEVVGQVCYQNVVGSFPQQKVAIMHGFDYRRIGLGEHESAPVQRRIDTLRQQMQSQPTVQTSIAAKPVVSVRQLIATVSR
jgi:hypothetical protein